MHALGLEVVRISARDVLADVDAIAQSLITMCADMVGPSTNQLR